MFRLFLFLSLLTLILGQITYEYQYQRDGHLGCTDEEGALRKLGEIWTERKSCTQRRCLPGTVHRVIVQIKRCPKIEASENCTIKAGNGNNFPDCCKSLVVYVDNSNLKSNKYCR